MSGKRVWLNEIRRISLWTALCGLLGGLLGQPVIGIATGLLGVVLYWGYHLRRIRRWLDRPEGEPPEGSGLWGVILDNIYLLQRRNLETQSRLKSSLDYLQDSLASMRDAAIIVDSRGNIAWANESCHFLLGITFPADRGQPLLNLIREPKFQHYFETDDYSDPLRIIPSAEGERCLQFEISHFGVGDRLVFVRDVTETFRLEQMRRDFVGNVSHELRTPLTVIKGYIDTLQGLEAFTQPRYQRPLQQMSEQTHRMETMIKDLLWLSRIETLEMQRKSERIDVPGLIHETVSELSAGYASRKLHLDISCDAMVMGDRQELHSAFSNLIINALKYSEDDVNIRWSCEGEIAVFAVADRGPGIARQHLPRLTERFYRVDKSRSQRVGGTGLGLAIVKHVATAHQAELKIDSMLGQGSTFALWFPIAEPRRNLSAENLQALP
ncbi:MAG: phosphate regulon sensor histidine kinase PhoR [Pseudomonadota bacterium]